ncbi:adhesion G-protein coupled receptor G4-like isoform X2 [Amphiura filiformis]|uniref:adhesion G-protein coupled receptor G4-like isoform X2 n=1 Tax=Amphiura filiformis TaxID=82378 RepID=UPI003B211908
MAVLLVAFIMFIQLVGSTDDTSIRVCSSITSYSQPYEENYKEFYKQIYYEPCGVDNENTCTKYRIFYRIRQRTSHRTIYRISYMCCKGWTMEDDVCKPICIPNCSYGGQCIRPNVCEYPPVVRPIMTMVRRSTDECSTSVRVIPTSYECEGSTFNLVCNSDETISITSALYGRQVGGSRCPGPVYTTSCAASNSLTVVRQRCNGRRTCSVSASNGIFGDPCQGTVKYLEIAYSCEGQCCPRCENDGTCTRQNHCQCPTGYTGGRCETPICSHACVNRGRCISPNICECPSEYTGNQCEILTKTCPDDIRVPNDSGAGGAFVTWKEVEVANTNVSSSHSRTDFFPIGVTTVTYFIVNDTLSATCSFTVDVMDIEPPDIVCPPDISGFADSGNISVPMNWQPLTATDNSGNITEIKCGKINGSDFPIGVTEVRCNVHDDSGNNGSCTFEVHIQARCVDIIINTSIGILSWPNSLVGEVVDSKERCPLNTERRNFGLASRECVYNSTSGAMWAAPTVIPCGQVTTPTIDDLAEITVDERNVKEVAETLANITKVNSNIESAATDINAIQEAFVNVVNVGSPSPEVTESVIEIVDNVLSSNISSEESDNSANASSMVLKAVEQQIAQTLKEHGKFTSVQHNIVVEAFTLDEAGSKEGVSFAVNFQAATDQQMSNSTANLTSNVTSSIVLPNEALFNNRSTKDTKVSFISYNENNLFRSRMLGKQNMTIVSGPVISAVVLGETFTNLDKPVIVEIFPSKVEEVTPSVLNSSVCVFWDFNQRNGIGDWSQDGCERIYISSGKTTCRCNHLTHFAVLVDVSGHQEQTTFSLVLDIISKIGCAFSIASLCLTLVILLLTRRLRETLPRKILIQFCLSMLCLYLVFLVGIDSKSGPGCLVVAGLLHYFVLTTVFWMGIEARNMYINLVTVFDIAGSTFLRKALCVAWGVPIIPVAVVMAVKWGDYVADAYCFLAPGYGLYFGVLLPVTMVILHNTVTFLIVMRKLLKSSVGGNVKNSTKTIVSQRLRNAFSISVLLGLTWIFGFLAINKARRAFQLMFCLCNSLQGVLVFVLFCLLQEDIRKVLVDHCSRSNKDNIPSGRSKKSDASSHELAHSVNTSIEAGKSYLIR